MISLLAGALTVGLNLYSWHSPTNIPETYKYESFTPGIYAHYGFDRTQSGSEWFAEAGVYRNSQGYVSPHIGAGYSWRATGWLDVSVAAGVVYGYRDWQYNRAGTGIDMGSPEVRPFVIPSVGVKLADEWKARVFIIPAAEKDSVWCLSFAIERRF